MRLIGLSLTTIFMSAVLLPSPAPAQAPVFEVAPQTSSIKFHVQSSMDLTGNFDKWKSSLTMTSPDVTTAVLDIEIQAASVDTGSGMKNGKLKDKDFFDVKEFPPSHSSRRESRRLEPTLLIFRAPSPSAESPNPKRCT